MISPAPSSPLPHRLLEQQALRTPENIAVVCGNDSLTFRSLNDRANELAGRLVRAGAGTGTYIGIGLPRSVDLLVALLGVLKAGAAYIPVDPSYPAERIAHMVAGSGMRMIVTDFARRKAFGETPILEIGQTAEETFIPASNRGSLDDPIYAIFTSGSTGLPKAASVFHRGFSNLLDWYVTELGLTANDTTLVISSPSFDLTQKNFFAPLITGGTLVLDEATNYDIHRISSLIRTHGVTLINCTPSAFYPLVEAAAGNDYEDLASLRFAVLGGEPISVPRLRAWLEHPACKAEVVNSYGPTECTDICAFHRLHRGNLDLHPFVPTGSEIPNVTVTIRSEELDVLPEGEIGELCIEGIGLGGGYLNDPVRTAEKFVGNLYRTGDLARRLPDGLIEFRGRADHQVKVNGFRIELGEIEIALSAHAAIREAVVLAIGDRLVAFVQGEVSAEEMRGHLAARLPAYMIPAVFRAQDRFPLTPNGKIDRKALLNDVSSEAQTVTKPARTQEEQLISIWSEVLERPVTDTNANFFDLGGTSINLAVVHVRLRKLTGSDLSITDLFAYPTIRTLSDFLSSPQNGETSSISNNRAQLQRAAFSNFRRPSLR